MNVKNRICPFCLALFEIDFKFPTAGVKNICYLLGDSGLLGVNMLRFEQIFTVVEVLYCILMVPVLNLKVGEHRLTLVAFFNVNKRSALVPEAKQLQFVKLVSLSQSAAFHTAAHPVRPHLTRAVGETTWPSVPAHSP